MKKYFLLFLFTISVLAAKNAKITWTPNPANESVIGYYLYQSVFGSSNWTNVAFTSNNIITLTNIAPASYKWRVTTTNAWGESLPSSEASLPFPPSAPFNLTIVITNE